MAHYKLSIAIFTAVDTIWWMKELAAIPKWTSSGHLRRSVDCHIHSGRYDMVDEGAGGHPKVTSSGHLRRFSTADAKLKSMSSAMYPSILS
eukprot:scaffold5366_cov88-Skeletonema_marinoi.AAC.1